MSAEEEDPQIPIEEKQENIRNLTLALEEESTINQINKDTLKHIAASLSPEPEKLLY